jgi:hypothetical protein
MKRARQPDFDQIVKDCIEQGASVEEACSEAVETFEESNYDMSGLFLYRNEEEMQEKDRIESRCKTIESVITNYSYVVNMIFALQGLSQIIKKEETARSSLMVNALHLMEFRKMFTKCISVLATLLEDDSNREEEEVDEDEEYKRKEDENRLLQKIELFDFMKALLLKESSLFHNVEEFYQLTADNVTSFVETLEENQKDRR